MIMTQHEYIQEIFNLAKENPDLQIHFCVASDELDEDFTWTIHRICRNMSLVSRFRSCIY